MTDSAPRANSHGVRHIAVIAPPLPGHWDPLRVVARLLVARGYRLTFLHMEDARTMLPEPELGFGAVGRATHGPGALARYKEQLARASAIGGFFEMIRATADIGEMLLRELPEALRRIGADAVIADETELAGALTARQMGLPYITSITGLPLLRDPAIPPAFVGWSYRPGVLGRQRNAGGHRLADLLMRPISRVHRRYAAAGRWHLRDAARGSPLLQIAQCPEGLDFPRTNLPPSFRYCGPFRSTDRPEVAPAGEGRPLVYCSLGSLQGNRPELFAAMTGACADLGARAVVAHGGLLNAAAAAGLPGNPIVASFWPQPAVLPRCSAAILHGGFNTVLDALAAGVPMVVAPLAFEQPGTAARVAHAGAGRAILAGVLRRDRLREMLGAVMQHADYRNNARRLAAEIRASGGAERAAALVDEAFRTGRTPGST